MEPPRKKKERYTKELMAQRCYLRAACHKSSMGRGKEESPRQDEVEKMLFLSMFQSRREGQILPVCFAISSKLVAWCCISW
jgi:hypothetical protein